MRKVWSWGCLAATVLVSGCNSPHLAISAESATVPAGSSMAFQALAQDSDGQITWTLSGPGSLDLTTGPQITYRAPPTYDPAGQHTAVITVQLSDAADQTRKIGITITQPSTNIGGIPGLDTNVTVTYDERDIPTITCTKTTDCYAVLGYIHARDRFFQMDFLRRAARGTLAELIGSSGADQDVSSRTVFTVRSRTASTPTAVALADELTAYSMTDPLVAPLFNAYTAGINTWIGQLRANPALLPGEYKQLLYPIDPTKTADVPDWSNVDTAAIERLQQFQLSANIGEKTDYGKWAQAYGQGALADNIKMAAWIRSKMPAPSYTLSGSGYPGTPAPILSPNLPPSAGYPLDGVRRLIQPLERLLKPLRERAGSNNWVVDGAHSSTGKAMVSNDPHLSLQYPSLFHLSHIIASEEGLNIIGSMFPGVPVTLIGRGAHVGWGVTVVGYDVTELYLEKLVANPNGTLSVVYNGSNVPLIVSKQTINVRSAQGMGTQDLTVLIVPHHGPIVSIDLDALRAVSVRWTGHETQTDDAHAFYRLNRAASVADAMQALDGDPKPDGGTYTGYFTGAQNFILADDQGNIGYDPHACVPFRPWAAHKFGAQGVYPAPATPVPGQGVPVTPVPLEWGDNLGLPLCVPNNLLPRADHSDKGFLATANSDPLGVSNDDNPYENNPNNVPYLSFNWDDGLGFRIQRIQTVLSSKIDAGTVSLDDLHALQADHVLTLAGPFLNALEAAGAGASNNPNVSAGSVLLETWRTNGLDCPTGLTGGTEDTGLDPVTALNDTDRTRSTDSAACLLFHTFLRRVLNATFADDAAIPGVNPSGQEAIRAFLWLVSSEGQAANTGNSLCSDVNSSGQKTANKTCLQQATDALGWAYAKLKNAYGAETNWRWGRVHTVTFANYLYPLVDQGFNPGPFARPGGASTVDVGNPSGGDPNNLNFAFTSAGNVRWSAVLDGTLANTTMQLPGLEEDGAFDPRKQGMLGQWLNNKYFNFPFKQSDVTSLRTETFNP
jgi:penicillin amidase